MGAVLWYCLFCCLVVAGVVTGIVAGLPTNVVAAAGIWTASFGAIVTVVYRSLTGWRSRTRLLE